MVWWILLAILLYLLLLIGTGLLLRKYKMKHQQEVSQLKQKMTALRAQAEAKEEPAPSDTPVNPENQAFLQRIEEIIDRDLPAGEVNVESIAAALNMSTQTFRRRLQNAAGASPKAYISRLQMGCAARMLAHETDLSMGEIAARCGFEDLSSFGHSFKRIYGCSPSKYREYHRGMEDFNK